MYNGQYQTISEFKKAMYKQRIDKLAQLKPINVKYNGHWYRNVDAKQLQRLMKDAMEEDIRNYT
ncbi:ZmpA/ZmpB/ZmpC family metallo-endopeptidase [Streptococcus sp. ZJ93]|uniref:ZmpA/ZmpB/ZmpC family metallo-endopeptidase n=1 Tax=Streptococcus handemini TaxID=3161188 RepID=UPI0034D66F69